MNEKQNQDSRFAGLGIALTNGETIVLLERESDSFAIGNELLSSGTTGNAFYIYSDDGKGDREIKAETNNTLRAMASRIEQAKNTGALSPDSSFVFMFNRNTRCNHFQNALESRLDNLGIRHWRANVCGNYPDVCTAYTENAAQAHRNFAKALNPSYEMDSLSNANYLESALCEFEDTTPPVDTGFENFNDLIGGGGLHPWLYVLGGMSSTGKTTFALQIADNIARNGGYALIFSAEMSRNALMARSISRETALLNGGNKLTQLEIQDGVIHAEDFTATEKDSYCRAVKAYSQYAGRIVVVENAGGNLTPGNIYRFVERYVSRTGRKPFVVVDYLQILSPDDGRADARNAVNMAMNALASIKVKFGVPVFLISSLNRDNYTKPLNLASYKESGNIEYGADVLLGLQFSIVNTFGKGGKDDNGDDSRLDAIQEAKKQNPREVEIVVLKNRTGISCGGVQFKYDAAHNHFAETEQHKYSRNDISPA